MQQRRRKSLTLSTPVPLLGETPRPSGYLLHQTLAPLERLRQRVRQLLHLAEDQDASRTAVASLGETPRPSGYLLHQTLAPLERLRQRVRQLLHLAEDQDRTALTALHSPHCTHRTGLSFILLSCPNS